MNRNISSWMNFSNYWVMKRNNTQDYLFNVLYHKSVDFLEHAPSQA